MLYFTGFTVIEPLLVHAPMRIGDDERAAYLTLYRERVLGLASTPTITYPKLADYDAHFVLKSRPLADRRRRHRTESPAELAFKAPSAR
jgi:NAD(P)H dehydrogenase (quinone)